MQECKILDKCISSADLDTIFIATNVTLTAMPNNDDNAIERFEMLEALVRIAMKKYVEGKPKDERPSPADAVDKLLNDHVLKHAQRLDMNQFRLEKFYTETCETILKPHMKALSIIFEGYNTSPARKLGAQKATLYMPMKDYMKMFMDIGYIDDQFVSRCVKISFVQSKLMYEDEMADERYKLMTFMDFLEAICRIVDVKYIHADERNPFKNSSSSRPGSKSSTRTPKTTNKTSMKSKKQMEMDRQEDLEFNRDKRQWSERLETLLIHFIGLCRLKSNLREVADKLQLKRNLAPSLYELMKEKGLTRDDGGAMRKNSLAMQGVLKFRKKSQQRLSQLDKRRNDAMKLDLESLVDGKRSKKTRRLSSALRSSKGNARVGRSKTMKLSSRTPRRSSGQRNSKIERNSEKMVDHNGEAVHDELAAAMRLAKKTVLARRASQEAV